MTIYGRYEELVSRCVECDLAEPESLASLGGSAPGVVDGILSPSMFDSDSQALMLDDGTWACITNDKNDFIEPPQWVDHKVKGIKGHAKATHRGIIKWYLEDNNGLVHVMVITGAYLIPEASTRILLPQHLAQQADDHYPSEEGTGALTTSKSITCFWPQRHFSKTVPLDPKTNVGLTTTASGTRSFRAFCTTVTVPETRQTNIFMTHIIPDEEDDESFQPKTQLSRMHRRKATKKRPSLNQTKS